jgi:solute carrier family 25 S-adenosylmethionine transporter 26
MNDSNHHKHTWKLYVAGAMAGAMASGIMTPMDLIKTKLSTGTCPVNEVQGCIQYVIEQNGILALWTGAGSRMISSALFSAIGFGTFETCQYYLNHQLIRPCSATTNHRKIAKVGTQ